MLKDGLDLSEKNLFHIALTRNVSDPRTLRNINFSGAKFSHVYLEDFNFINSNFSGARFANVYIPGSTTGSNFQDAWFRDSAIPLDREQLLSTASYKAKRLVGVSIGGAADGDVVSFAGFDLRRATIGGYLAGFDFTDAIIEGAVIGPRPSYTASGYPTPSHILRAGLRVEQLLLTKDFKRGVVKGVTFSPIYPDHVVDFSNMVFVDCVFGGSGQIDLTNSVISGCDFRFFGYTWGDLDIRNIWAGRLIPYGSGGITVDNIKSTWNYKHGRMEGIILPHAIQAALDAEKEKQ
jgi:uncharacterized protein YjbI with pentapeptide repeats